MGETVVVERAALTGSSEAVYWELIEVASLEICMVALMVSQKAVLMVDLMVEWKV
jgi:hypothetical protein